MTVSVVIAVVGAGWQTPHYIGGDDHYRSQKHGAVETVTAQADETGYRLLKVTFIYGWLMLLAFTTTSASRCRLMAN